MCETLPSWALRALCCYLMYSRVGSIPLKEGRPLRLAYAVRSHADSPPFILKLVNGQLPHQASQITWTRWIKTLISNNMWARDHITTNTLSFAEAFQGLMAV